MENPTLTKTSCIPASVWKRFRPRFWPSDGFAAIPKPLAPTAAQRTAKTTARPLAQPRHRRRVAALRGGGHALQLALAGRAQSPGRHASTLHRPGPQGGAGDRQHGVGRSPRTNAAPHHGPSGGSPGEQELDGGPGGQVARGGTAGRYAPIPGANHCPHPPGAAVAHQPHPHPTEPMAARGVAG